MSDEETRDEVHAKAFAWYSEMTDIQHRIDRLSALIANQNGLTADLVKRSLGTAWHAINQLKYDDLVAIAKDNAREQD